jgi:two-component system, chemotaxis family, CheB/CheR fusion protein
MGTLIDVRDRTCLAGVRILIVDDDEDVRDALVSLLGLFGADACAVEGAGVARALLAAWTFDVLLSDIEMPGESGYDLIRTVRRSARTRDLPAAAITGRAAAGDCCRALAAGFDLVIAKPPAVELLVESVGSLAARQPRRERRRSAAAHL